MDQFEKRFRIYWCWRQILWQYVFHNLNRFLPALYETMHRVAACFMNMWGLQSACHNTQEERCVTLPVEMNQPETQMSVAIYKPFERNRTENCLI
jgi:hypothetical protein